jgi:hypothetical protein
MTNAVGASMLRRSAENFPLVTAVQSSEDGAGTSRPLICSLRIERSWEH